MSELTPMMRQYRQIKEQNPDCILFFRLGDFYEMFDEDARTASRELDLTLTTRDRSKEKDDAARVPMCGVPYHSSEAYIARLIARGYKVAICDQMEDPALAKGLVKREVTRLVTPGAVTESSMLEESKNNYYACVFGENGAFGVSFCDISTGAVCATCFTGSAAEEAVCSELGAFSPAEVLLGGDALRAELIKMTLRERLRCCVDTADDAQFDESMAESALRVQLGQTPQSLGMEDYPCAVRAAGALLRQLRSLQKNELPQVRSLEFYMSGKFMGLDLTARRNLELTQTLRSQEKRGSLLWVLDRTRTAMGGRLLRSWMERPLLSPAQIEKRLGAVSWAFCCAACPILNASSPARPQALPTAATLCRWRRAPRRCRRSKACCRRANRPFCRCWWRRSTTFWICASSSCGPSWTSRRFPCARAA